MEALNILATGARNAGLLLISNFRYLINELNKERNIFVNVNTIYFQPGGNENQEERNDDRQVLQAISEESNGNFKDQSIIF